MHSYSCFIGIDSAVSSDFSKQRAGVIYEVNNQGKTIALVGSLVIKRGCDFPRPFCFPLKEQRAMTPYPR